MWKVIMTQPALALATSFGRLYRRPETPVETIPSDPAAALAAGVLFPSVTNVIGVLDKPYLNGWYAREAAKAAVEVEKTHPGLIRSKPWDAINFLKDAAPRKAAAAAALGDVVHNTVELLGAGQDIDAPDEVSAAYVDNWRRFVKDYDPTFTHLEATCFGTVLGPDGQELHYAGTTDFIASIGGNLFVGDYKTGRAVHTEAGLQLAALANAHTLVTSDGEVIPMPRIDGGMVVHVNADMYRVWPVVDWDAAWAAFGQLRQVWQFHQENLVSRNPIILGAPVAGPQGLTLRR
jgi:hypothetical protein